MHYRKMRCDAPLGRLTVVRGQASYPTSARRKNGADGAQDVAVGPRVASLQTLLCDTSRGLFLVIFC